MYKLEFWIKETNKRFVKMVNNFKKLGILISIILFLFAINYIFAEGSSILKYYIELFNYVGVMQSTIYGILAFISFLALASLIFQKNRFSYAISITLMESDLKQQLFLRM